MPMFCKFATTFVFKIAAEDVDEMYSHEDCLALDNCVDDMIEDQDTEEGWMDDVFSVTSKLKFEDFLKNTKQNGYWIFDATKIREKIFKMAEIEIKHAK